VQTLTVTVKYADDLVCVAAYGLQLQFYHLFVYSSAECSEKSVK